MKLSNIRAGRPITSYAAVRKHIGNVVRNSTRQLRSERVQRLKYLDLGCGPNTHEDLINLDYLWHPKVDICWDVTRGLPFNDRSLHGIYSEHCLEHFPLPLGEAILREAHRCLKPGGHIRIIVPDAELYLTQYTDRIRGLTDAPLPYEQSISHEGISEPVLAVNRIFYQDRADPAGHHVIYDFRLLSRILDRCGFKKVTRTAFMNGSDEALLIDTPSRSIESIYVEAVA